MGGRGSLALHLLRLRGLSSPDTNSGLKIPRESWVLQRKWNIWVQKYFYLHSIWCSMLRCTIFFIIFWYFWKPFSAFLCIPCTPSWKEEFHRILWIVCWLKLLIIIYIIRKVWEINSFPFCRSYINADRKLPWMNYMFTSCIYAQSEFFKIFLLFIWIHGVVFQTIYIFFICSTVTGLIYPVICLTFNFL